MQLTLTTFCQKSKIIQSVAQQRWQSTHGQRSKPVASVFKKGCQKVCYKLSLDELATLFWEVEGFWKDQKTYKEYYCLQRTSIKKESRCPMLHDGKVLLQKFECSLSRRCGG